MKDSITKEVTGSAALAFSLKPGNGFELDEFTLHVGVAPTTSEYFTVTKNAGAGAVHDTLIYRKDLSTLNPTDVYFSCAPGDFDFEAGDTIDFAWTNTDTKTYGLQTKFKRKD